MLKRTIDVTRLTGYLATGTEEYPSGARTLPKTVFAFHASARDFP